ncbi:hypothetical protein E2C01_075813 [Portunus trituberculatus]|uniref:Uncharacterized protein n=1 Tax=Portunus trituberculatus TaxID=210409 RepID=A0A5B7IGR5_PORTR|nr:hypothetical protein [Portunus trituberculatus]
MNTGRGRPLWQGWRQYPATANRSPQLPPPLDKQQTTKTKNLSDDMRDGLTRDSCVLLYLQVVCAGVYTRDVGIPRAGVHAGWLSDTCLFALSGRGNDVHRGRNPAHRQSAPVS